jgi:hypothetical protein
MKKDLFFLLFFLSTFYSSKAQDYCNASFSAYSIKIGAYCKYCNNSSTFVIPKKIKFNITLVCESLNNPRNASTEGMCKLTSIMHYMTYLYYNAWYKGVRLQTKLDFS